MRSKIMSRKMIRNQFQKEIKKGTGKALLLMRENPEVDFDLEKPKCNYGYLYKKA